MSNDTLVNSTEDTGSTDATSTTQERTYTQADFDKHMAGLKASMQKKFEKQLEGLGDIEELRQLKAQADQLKQEQSLKRGEFDKVLQELAAKKDQEIAKRDSIIKDYRVNTPLLAAAAKFQAVNAEQVKALLVNNVRMNADGDVEVVDSKGTVRYSDAGTPLGVEDLVKEFLNQNPHFVQPTPATTNTKSNIAKSTQGKVDVASLDMKNPAHRKLYAEAKAKGQI